MGVNSLWKALDEAGCGRPVGIREMSNPDEPPQAAGLRGVNPWNVHRQAKPQQQQTSKKKGYLAVDLSIWICESLSSHMVENHANPAIHLVFTRTVKLLSMGIGLVFVIEGKRRIRDPGITSNDQDDRFRKRRSGTAFWKACKDCHDMLKLMGVTVVRAKAEGEALCALLNQSGIVDGVISNDGDCLLFGAKVVYAKFSIDNLENNRVLRYDLDKLSAVVEVSDDRDLTSKEIGRCRLSRQDLISFALLTGSDLAGGGLDKVGYKKAVRFIRKCQLDDPMNTETAAIEELKSWARSVAPCERDPFDDTPLIPPKAAEKCCSLCNHPGTKSNHLKHGCAVCGTEPGEACLECTTEDRFRQSLRVKALALFPKFDPSQVVDAYTRPNDNSLPVQFCGRHTPIMTKPDLSGLMKMKIIVKGRTPEASREFVKTAVGRLLSRALLLEPQSQDAPRDGEDEENRKLGDDPVPLEITKTTTVGGVPSYHISWHFGRPAARNGNADPNGYEYTTVEPQNLVQRRFPEIVAKFQQDEKERNKQGDAEKKKRREFLASLWIDASATAGHREQDEVPVPSPHGKKRSKKRKSFFEDGKRPRPQIHQQKKNGIDAGDDVYKLLRCVKSNQPDAGDSSIESTPSSHDDSNESEELCETPNHRRQAEDPDAPLSPLYCHFGSYLIPISPIDAMVPGEYPPRRIYVRRGHFAER